MTIPVNEHIAISRLMYRYAYCADHKDYAGFADVFSEDAVFLYMGAPVTSLQNIQEMMLALEKYSRTLHQVSNVLYDVVGDRASGETYCLASHIFTEDEQEKKIDMGIIYTDELRKTEVGWRIERREFDVLWTTTCDVEVPGAE
ncbi:MAG: nuclear transport factor 2 family protein [Halioglobus sp.]